MRIISKSKDYYDCIMAHDQDRETLYVREPAKIDMSEAFGWGTWIFPRFYPDNPYPGSSAFRQHIIGFCGNIYPALEFEWGGQCTFCYSLDAVDAWFRQHVGGAAFEQYTAGRTSHRSRYRPAFTHAHFQDYFRRCEEDKGKFAQLFIDRRSPIFAAHHEVRSGDRVPKLTMEWNALLKPYEFFRKFDVNQAYQELRMYISNMAFPDKPIPQLSNEDLAASKGHGDKYSFRKAPSK
jgi:hypothetical protein